MLYYKIFRSKCLILFAFAASMWVIYLKCLRDLPAMPLDPGDSESVIAEKIPIKIPVDVFYSSLCPDSRSFFLNQLLPTVHKYSVFLTVNLIPYGRAETIDFGNSIYFRCQHGPDECIRNRIHACVSKQSMGDDVLAVNVTSCLFEEFFEPVPPVLEKCCQKFGFKPEHVNECVNGRESTVMLKKYGELTSALLPIDFIPTIAINKFIGPKQYQVVLLKNLTGEISKISKLYHLSIL